MNGSRQLFECVPNFSEGRDLGVIRALTECAADAGVYVADVTSDADHHRSVLTWFGTAQEITQAADRCLTELAQHQLSHGRSFFDLDGVHPRTGLLDVMPLVPTTELGIHAQQALASTMADAVTAARSVSQELATVHQAPAYWYEHAASDESRRNLADHRRALAKAGPTQSAAGWPSDAGPDQTHPTKGVLLVGARSPLVAFNLELDSTSIKVARRIAARVRATAPGGLPGVKALGLSLERRGCAQVSVNLVDANATTLPQLVERVQQLAAEHGVAVRACELIGLATEQAVAGAAAHDLLLPELDQRHLAEFHLARALDRHAELEA